MRVFRGKGESGTEEASYITIIDQLSPTYILPIYSPPYSLTSSDSMIITSHSKTLLSTSPQLIPGILSLSDCICCNCRESIRPAGVVAMVGSRQAEV